MPDRQSEHGSWVHKNTQSAGAGCDGSSKNFLIAWISPCHKGLAVSSLAAATITDKSDLRRIAAPKILFPDATPSRVSGAMSYSITSSKRTSVGSGPGWHWASIKALPFSSTCVHSTVPQAKGFVCRLDGGCGG